MPIRTYRVVNAFLFCTLTFFLETGLADEVTVTSTTNTPDEVRAALGMKPETPAAVTILPHEETPVAETPPAKTEVKPDAKAEDAAAADAAKTLAKRRGTLQDRLDRLTREKLTAREEAASLRRELDTLRAGRTTAEPVKTETPPAPAVVAPEPKSEDFEEFNDYLKARSLYDRQVAKEEAKVEMRAEIQRQREADKREADQARETATAKEQQTAFDARMNAARKRHPDLDEVLEQNTNVPVSATMKAAIHHEEYGAELLYYWATHATEADEIAALNPAQALKAIGKLEARYEAGTLFNDATDDDVPETLAEGVAVRKGEKVPVSKAPAPPTRVGGGAAAVAKDPDRMTQKEYNAMRDAQIRARKRR